MNYVARAGGALAAVLLTVGTIAAYKKTVTVQRGYPGVGMDHVESRERLIEKSAANVVPPSLPPAAPGGQLAVDAYKNVQVLGHLTSGEFTRLMTSITLWVSPEQGCAYCHAPQRDAQGKIVRGEDGLPLADNNNLHSDELYTKRVARRMLQMTHRINSDWKQHVAATGVTCYTCHRGQPVPSNIWFDVPESQTDARMVGAKAHQNAPAAYANLSSLPNDALRAFLVTEPSDDIRVQSGVPIDDKANRRSIKQTEWTYSLMTHMSEGLGVNCSYCHNSRSWSDWSQSPLARTTAWYGIRMVRELNSGWLEPLKDVFPRERLGPLGDVPKMNCATCHNGAYKPLLGVSMLKDHPALAEAKPQPAKTAVAQDPSADAGAALVAAGALEQDGGAVLGGDGGAVLTAEAGTLTTVAADAGAQPTDAGPNR